jgi:hypothetical protein
MSGRRESTDRRRRSGTPACPALFVESPVAEAVVYCERIWSCPPHPTRRVASLSPHSRRFVYSPMASARSHAHRPHGAWPYASMVVVTRQLPLARQPLDHASPFTNRDQSSGGAIATPYKIFESGILPRIVLPSLVLVASVHPHDPSSCPAIAPHLCLRCRSARLRHSEERKAGLRGWWFRLSRRAAVSSCLRFCAFVRCGR